MRFSHFFSNRFVFKNGGELPSEVVEQEKAKNKLKELAAAQAAELLKDPNKLRYFVDAYLEKSPGHPQQIRQKLIAKIMTTQELLRYVVNSRMKLGPERMNEDFVVSDMLKYLDESDDFFKRLMDTPNQDRLVKEAALKRIKDIPYKTAKMKAGFAALKTNVLDATSGRLPYAVLGDDYWVSKNAISTLKNVGALKDLLATVKGLKTQLLDTEAEKKNLIERLQDQLKQQGVFEE